MVLKHKFYCATISFPLGLLVICEACSWIGRPHKKEFSYYPGCPGNLSGGAWIEGDQESFLFLILLVLSPSLTDRL